MGKGNTLLGSLLISVIGSYGCAQQEQKSNRTNRSEQDSEQDRKKENVNFNFSLPTDFLESDENVITVGKSTMAKKFEKNAYSDHIKVTCDDESSLEYSAIKHLKLRGILNITLTQFNNRSEGGLLSLHNDDCESADLREEKERCMEVEPDGNETVEDEDEFFELDAISVPFTCNGSANIQIVNLEGTAEYVVDAALFSSHGKLKYTGSTDYFDRSTRKVELLMVQESSLGETTIQVEFEKRKNQKRD